MAKRGTCDRPFLFFWVVAIIGVLLTVLAVPTLVLGVWWGPLVQVIDGASSMLE